MKINSHVMSSESMIIMVTKIETSSKVFHLNIFSTIAAVNNHFLPFSQASKH